MASERRLCQYCREEIIFHEECRLFLEAGEGRCSAGRPNDSTVTITQPTSSGGRSELVICADVLCARTIATYEFNSEGMQIVTLKGLTHGD